MARRKEIFSIIVLALLFVATRAFALLHAGSFWFDEAFSVHFAAMPMRRLWQFLQYEHNPLLHFFTLKGWMSVLGGSELSARQLSTVLGAATVALIYILGRRLYNARVAFFAAFLTVVSTLSLYHQTEARMYALEGFLAITLMWLAWEIRQRAHHRGLMIAYAITATMLVHTHLTAWNVVLALIFYWLAEWKSKFVDTQRFTSIMYAHATAVLLFLPWLIPVLRNKFAVGGTAQGWFLGQYADGYFFTHLTNFLVNGESSLPLRVAAAVLTSLLLVSSFLTVERPDWWQRISGLFSREQWPFRFTVQLDAPTRFLLILFGAQLFTGFAVQVTVTKYLYAVSMPLFLLMARGYDRWSSQQARVLTFVAVIAIVAPMHIRLYTTQRHHWNEVSQTIDGWHREFPDAPIVVHSFAYTLLLDRYLDLATNQSVIPFYPRQDQLSSDERIVRFNWQAVVNEQNVQQIGEITKNQNDIILVSSTAQSGEQDPVKKWFWSHGWTLVKDLSYKGYGDPEVLLFSRTR